MDPSRRQRLTEMGLTDWQLRHPARLAMGPQVTEATPGEPHLWIKGPVPAWVMDLCLAFGLSYNFV